MMLLIGSIPNIKSVQIKSSLLWDTHKGKSLAIRALSQFVKFILISSSAGVMHGALGPTGSSYQGGPAVRPKLNSEVIPAIQAVVLFGDPGFRGSVPSVMGGGGKLPEALFAKLRQNCAKGDPVCDPVTPAGFENHLDYAKPSWQGDSANFIIAAFKGQPLPKAPRVPEDQGMIPKTKGATPPIPPRVPS
jgi:hypothetical protein